MRRYPEKFVSGIGMGPLAPPRLRIATLGPQ